MKRYYALNEMLQSKKLELYSELEPKKFYTIEGNEFKYVGTNGEGNHEFIGTEGNAVEYSTDDIQQLIDAGDVRTVTNPEPDESLSNFPLLDKFTRYTFGVPSHELLDLNTLNETDLYTLEALIQKYGLKEMPLPGEGRYAELIADEHWPTLKRYLQAISPDIDLPEELG